MLISFAVTAKLICAFVFAYAKSRFSHDAPQITLLHSLTFQLTVTVLTMRMDELSAVSRYIHEDSLVNREKNIDDSSMVTSYYY